MTVHRMIETRSFPPMTSSPREARLWAIDWCARSGCEAATDSVTLVLSELVTNAVIHAESEVTVTLAYDDDQISGAVADRGPGRITSVEGPPWHRTSGRGLLIVATLVRSWNVDYDEHGKTVRFAINCRTMASAGQP